MAEMRWIVFIIAISSVYGEKERVEDGGMASKIRSHRDHHIDAQAIIGKQVD